MIRLPSLSFRQPIRIALMASVLALFGSGSAFGQTETANSLAELRAFGTSVNNTTVTLSATGGDAHPVTGIVTPGHYWINGDHIANPTNSMPIFMDLGGTGNTYDLSGATINLDTRKLDGFGRNLGHDSGVDVIQINGSNNTVQGINLIGQDIALDTDPNAQRYADWATQYVELSGDNNTVDGANVVTRGSRTDSYGLGDAFGKGSSQGITPFLAHRKASAFRVGEATNAVINDMHLDVNTFGHGFFVQASTNTTLTNSTVTGELFSSQGVIDHPLYQQYGHTYHQNEIPDDIMISGNEGGVRMYTGSSGLTVDNVVVTNMRTGFATSLGGGTKTLNNVEAYGVESAFDLGNDTTITNAKADGVNGPVLVVDRDIRHTASAQIELVGNQPINHDYALVYVNGSDIDIDISSDRPAEDFEGTSLIRTAQFYYDNWRETNNTTTFDVAGYDHVNSVLINDTNTPLVLGEQAEGNTGRSTGGVISNGKNNEYDGVTLVFNGTRLTAQHVNGMGNGGDSAAGTLDSNGTIVSDGSTLEIQAGLRIVDEKLVITGDGVDGKGALYSEGTTSNGDTRFGSSNSSDESTVFLDGNASIGVGGAGKGMLVGRIQGTGDLTKLGAGTLSMEKSSTFDGDLIVAQGRIEGRTGVFHSNLTVASGASVSAIAVNTFNTTGDVDLDGTLDINSRDSSFTSNLDGTIGRLNGSGRITSSNPTAGSGGMLTLAGNDADGLFTGAIDGAVSLVKSGANSQSLAGFMTYTGTTTVDSGSLFINGLHTGGGDYTVNGGTLGGTGSIVSNVIVNSGATLAAGSNDSIGTLGVGGNYSQASGSTLALDIQNATNYDGLIVSGTTSLSGNLSLTAATPAQLNIGDTLTLVNSIGPSSGEFSSISGVAIGAVDGFSSGLAVQYGTNGVTARVSIMGDADLSNDVGNSDIGAVFGSFGTTVDPLWTAGNFDGDNDVDNTDIGTVFGNFGAMVSEAEVFAALFSTSENLLPESKAELIYDSLTGRVTLEGNEAEGGVITNFVLNSSSRFINTENLENPFLGSFFRSDADEISASDLLATGLSSIDLGMVLAPNLTQADLFDLFSTSTYVESLGSGVQRFDIVVSSVPEPASAIFLVALGMPLMLRRRRS